MNKIKRFILKRKGLLRFVLSLYNFFPRFFLFVKIKRRIRRAEKAGSFVVFYLGEPVHANLGDLAQGVCIRRWISSHYPGQPCVEIETNAIVNTPFSILKILKKYVKKNDLFFFQSGYTTTDLGGYADVMHRAVIHAFPSNKMMMFPQTVFFRDPSNQAKSSNVYQENHNLVFLARDSVSYETALSMFPSLKVFLFPDIVTSLIGQFAFSAKKRKGILFCLRNDGEKFYSSEDLNRLEDACKAFDSVSITDTTLTGKKAKKHAVAHPEDAVLQEIGNFSNYRLIITDRYHGTIFSLIAGTPVIVLKTNDHKVVTGVDWFHGIYDDHICLAQDLDDALAKAKEFLKNPPSSVLEPHFKREYFDPLLKTIGWEK